jgi:hypothetical protein
MVYRRLTRRQRREILSAYLSHLFPGLPLAVYECALAAGPDPTSKGKAAARRVSGRGAAGGGGLGGGAGLGRTTRGSLSERPAR